jgi:holliday junction DNA helicase RuvA
MIARIRGLLVQKDPGTIIVEAGGIGYQVFVSLTTFYDLPDVQQNVTLQTYTHVREDLLQLFGFSTPLEKELFQILIEVSGIGPKLARNILSGISPQELLQSLEGRDGDRLTAIPGIGRKIAERMVVDLQEKARKIQSRWALAPQEKAAPQGVAEDVVSALLNLGYKKGQAEKAAERVLRENPGYPLEEALKESLKILAVF